MKSINKKFSVEKENKDKDIKLNESSEEKEEENSSFDDEKEKNEEKIITNLFIHLTLITKLIKKTNGEYPCICHNLSKEDIIENNKININKNIQDINNQNSFLEEEIIPNLEINMTSDKKIFMKDIISKLKYLGYPTTGALFSVYIKSAEEYVYLGSDPIDPNLFLDESLVDFENLKIKLVSYLEDKLIKKTEKQLFDKKDNNKNQKDKRIKERKIEFIVEKVNAWRRLYNGFYNEKGEYTRYSLEQAAKMVGISIKSLDDYLLQLRLGRKYGFNFNQNKTKKVGILRSFVKRHRIMKSNQNNNINININDSYILNKDNIDEDLGEEENEQQGSNDSDYSGE